MNSNILSSKPIEIPVPAVAGAAKSDALVREGQTYDIVCKMENPLWTIHDILTAIGMMVIEMDGDEAIGALQRLVSIAQRSFEEAEALRARLFHLNHPDRDDVAKERANEA
ncbi:hypothetical protein FHX08_004796 [Rhizobium sp. BK529]|uniref:hypothetical protein n=1 Tax=Rhizobium sp. BK529 TaxID=2586983 RepID=UPI00161261D3|nr:hypothetical protein [Rhizobium sp. BK529]MBB3594392.1 hypothetical protein [Rhizobium sp. BK529]